MEKISRYKVLLVDDEALIRNAIKANIRWQELGFDLVGLADDGHEAIEKIEALRPDVVLTDIYMPFATGLDVSRYCYENYPGTKVVIITGYDEFVYAKKALEYKVSEFILKPVTAKQLSDILVKLKKELDESARQALDLEKIKDDYFAHLPVIIARFLNRLICYGGDLADADKQFTTYNLHLDGHYKALARLRIQAQVDWLNHHPEFNKDLLLFVLFNVSEELCLEEQGLAFQNTDGETILLLADDNGERVAGRLTRLCLHINAILGSRIGLDLLAALSAPCAGLSELHTCFSEATARLDFIYGHPNQRLFGPDSPEQTNENFSASHYAQILETAVEALRQDAPSRCAAAVDDGAAYLLQFYATKKALLPHLQSLSKRLYEAACIRKDGSGTVSGIDPKDTAFDESATRSLQEAESVAEQKIADAASLPEAVAAIKARVPELCALYRQSGADIVKRTTVLALDYMERHYQDKNLTLGEVCRSLSISQSYFSAIFKEGSGETFTVALTRIRMDHAKQLLENSALKSYEIAEQVGFSDSHYFSLVFKRQVGMTSKAYARRCRQARDETGARPV